MNHRTCGHWIDGRETEASTRDSFDDLNPLDDSLFARAAKGSREDIDAAVNAAHRAFSGGALESLSGRETWLSRTAELLERDSSEFEEILIDEIGSPVGKAKHEVQTAIETLRAASGIPRQVAGKSLPSNVPGRLSISIRRPLGVIAGITPFNVPLIKAVKHSAMPLATGNSVVLMPSDEAPMIAIRLAQTYGEAGVPDGCVNVVCGSGYDIGDDLVTHPQVRAVGYTGSTKVGRHIQALCGKHGKRVTLEMGGKNPLIILGDADLHSAVRAATFGSFMFQGQICMSSSRIFVQRSVADDFLHHFHNVASKLAIGDLRDPKTMIGPIINEKQRQRIDSHLQDAVDKGAKVELGGDWDGNCYRPTILTNVDDHMLIYHEETFGPVTCAHTVDSPEEALVRANETNFGLVAGVFTANVDAALEMANQLDAGMVHVNGMTIQQEPHAPFGGVGDSGFGREGTEAAIDEMTEWKWITIDRNHKDQSADS